MLKSYKKVWSVCRTYNVEVGKHSTEAAAEADLQKVLGSPNWADAQSTHLKAVEIAEKHAEWLNNATADEMFDAVMEREFNQSALDTTIQSDISGHSVRPSDLFTYCYDIHKPEVTSYWEITRWGRLRQKVAGRLYRLADRVGVHDPDYDPDYYDSYYD
jgi:hypothetical protein